MSQRSTLLRSGVIVLLALILGCGTDPTEPPPGTGAPDTSVTAFMSDLPPWTTFSPLMPEAPPTPVSAALPLPDTVVTDSTGDDGSTRFPIPPVTYSCTETEYSLASTPDEIVMYSPDTDILWPGALIQGRSHKEPLGSLLGLTIAQRTPINVSIPELSGGNNFRAVEGPNQATVANAISQMVGDATTAGLPTGSDISYVEETSFSASQFALSAALSGKYLGFSGSASGSFERQAQETTVSVHFVEKMFTAQVAPPQTPDAFFSEAFTGAVLQAQIDQGNIGPDNIPVYVSKVVYGRMMIYNFTSSASQTDIKAAIDAAYNVGLANVDVSLRTKYRKILQTARITVQTVGGPSQAALDVIRTGDRRAFFTDAAPLSTALPLSYEFRGLSNGNPVAAVTESTSYTLKECTAVAATPGTFRLLPISVEAAAPFVPDSIVVGDSDADGNADLFLNRLGATNDFRIARSTGNGSFSFSDVVTHPDTPIEGWANYQVAVADLNDDGRADLIWNHLGTENKTYLAIAQANGSYAFPSVKVHPNNGWGPYTMTLGDTDNDGNDDLIWTENSGRRIYVARSDGMNGLEFLNFQDHPNASGTPQRLVGDIDGMPGVDLVYNIRGSTASSLYTATAVGGGLFNLRTSNNTYNTGTDWRSFTAFLGDVDNRNGDDVISFRGGDGGAAFTTVHVRTSNGLGGFETPVVQVTPFTDPTDPANAGPFEARVGDFNGDGRADIFWNTLTSVNRSYVGLGLSNGRFDFSPERQLNAGAENWALFSVHTGDFNGDGRTDVLWVHPAVDTKIYVGLGQQ